MKMNDEAIISNIDKEYIIKAPLDEVWDCLTDGDISSLWQGQDCIIGTKVGDELSLFGNWVTGIILEIEVNRKLSYTWKSSEWAEETKPSRVSYTLEKIDKSTTKIKLTHYELPSLTERNNHEKGWDEQFFNPLTEFLEMPAKKENQDEFDSTRPKS